MAYIDVWKKKMQDYGVDENKSRINTSKSYIKRHFKYDDSYRDAIIQKLDMSRENIDIRIKIVDNTTSKRRIIFPPDTKIEVGSYLEYDNEIWLIREFQNEGLSPYGVAYICNQTLNWEGLEQPIPCYTEDSAYNDKGEIIIIDVKTYADSTVKLNEQAKHGWKGQTTDYKDLIENNTGGKVIGIYAFPIKVSYSKNATVVDGKLKEGIAPASVNATYSTIDSNILVNLSTVEEVKPAEDKPAIIPKSDKLFDFDADDDIDIPPFGKKAEQLQSSICINNNI